MDLLRSCYSGRIQFVRGSPTTTAAARWYFAAPSALPFPHPHNFGSPTWDYYHPMPTPIGWDSTFRTRYYNGRRTNTSRGTTYAGPLDYFVNGAPGPAPLERGVNGTPVECLQPPFGLALGGASVPVVASKGGKLLGGQVVSSITPGIPCVACSGITPATLTVSLSGFVAPYTAFNGTFSLSQVSPCTWTFQISPSQLVEVQRLFGPDTWLLNTFDTLVSGAWQLATPDCVSPVSLPIVFSTMGGSATQFLSAP